MKMKQYTITTGAYDNYKIVAQIEGAATPALSTLYKQFETIAFRDEPFIKELTGMDIMINQTRKYHAHNRLRTMGYKGEDLAELFINWLKTEHGFVEIKKNEFYVRS